MTSFCLSSGCHVTDSDVATCYCARLPAGSGDVALGGHSCVLEHVIGIVGGGWQVCIVAAIGDVGGVASWVGVVDDDGGG